MNHIEQIRNLSCWQGEITVAPLSGGMTNHNFVVEDGGRRYVVRLGEDIPEHLLWRRNEKETSRIAANCGFSPQVLHQEQGILVIDFVDGKVYEATDVRDPANMARIVELLQRFHTRMPERFDTYPVLFWVFQVIRHYGGLLQGQDKPWAAEVPGLLDTARDLEQVVGEVRLVFAHNDLLPANFIDDGDRLWLIDFDYAGFNSPLFDLANLASNAEMDRDGEQQMLQQYFEQPADEPLRRKYSAMKCASLMREMMWSMVSEVYSKVEFDYTVYTKENTERFHNAYRTYQQEYTD